MIAPTQCPTDAPISAPSPTPLAVSAKQLAAMLGVSVRTIRSMDASGWLPEPVLISSRLIRWPVAEIEAWLRAGAPSRADWDKLQAAARERRAGR